MTTWSFVLAVLIAIFALYLSSTAGRLDRLHLRIEADLVALDRQLQHRCGAASELIAAAVFDPATTILLGQAVHQARTADREDRVGWAMSESKLTGHRGGGTAGGTCRRVPTGRIVQTVPQRWCRRMPQGSSASDDPVVPPGWSRAVAPRYGP
jgi:hypothetical protein